MVRLRPAGQAASRDGPGAAAVSRPKLDEVVRDYEKAVPNTNAAQTIEALSIAYCRAIVSDKIPTAQSNAKIANFSQQVAIALTE